MEKRCLAVCLVMCLAMGSLAAAATIPSGEVTYWDGHYLAGQPVSTGSDVFGWNLQAQRFDGPGDNAFLPWAGLPPITGDRNSDWWMTMQWNAAYLSTQDGDDPGSHLDFHPFVDWPGANHDTADGNWQGSGAVVSVRFSEWWEVEGKQVRWWSEATWVAAPSDGYFELLWGSLDDPCYCGVWYEYEGGPVIGQTAWACPAGERWQWAEVQHLTYCPPNGLVCNTVPTYPPGLGPPWGR